MLVVPAFGTYTGALNILTDPFEPLFGNDGMHVWMLGQGGRTPSRRASSKKTSAARTDDRS